MPISHTVVKCSLPVAHDVCFAISGGYYVTSQPIYVWPGTSPYQVIAQNGIRTVLSVRDPQEVILPLTPVDLTEVSQLITNNVAFTNVPFPHIAMTQPQFNEQAFKAATVIKEWPRRLLIHCSTGDRASCLRRLSDHLRGCEQQRGGPFRADRARPAEPAIHRLARKVREALSARQHHGTSFSIAASQCRPSKYFGLIAARSISSMQRALTSILSGSDRGT
jgi:protein tyrosine phosphatase (PTP) superfamily phosphohydrolase (DUF442 family)